MVGQRLPMAHAAAGLAAINCIGQLGSFASAWLWGVAKDATGGYALGLTVLPAAFGLAAAILLADRAWGRARAGEVAPVVT